MGAFVLLCLIVVTGVLGLFRVISYETTVVVLLGLIAAAVVLRHLHEPGRRDL